MDDKDQQGGEIVNLIPSDEIVKILECPVCKDAPVPPILTCESGHIICAFCRPKLDHCAVCRESYTTARNFPLEAIFHGSTFVCKYKSNGCPEIIQGDVYWKHLRNCKFRSITCSYCAAEIHPIDNYIGHIKTLHGAYGYDAEEAEFFFKNWTNDIYFDSLYGDDYAFYDGKYFVSSLEVKNQVVYQWISIVGDEEDAKKYTAKITILKKSDDVPRVQWTIPVVSIQNGEPDYTLCTAIPVEPTLSPYLLRNVKFKDGKTWDYVWYHKYTIHKN